MPTIAAEPAPGVPGQNPKARLLDVHAHARVMGRISKAQFLHVHTVKIGDHALAYVKPDARDDGCEHRRVALVEVAGDVRTADKYAGHMRETVGGELLPPSTKVTSLSRARHARTHAAARARRSSTSYGARASPRTTASSSFRARRCANGGSPNADPVARTRMARPTRVLCGIATRSRSPRCASPSSTATSARET